MTLMEPRKAYALLASEYDHVPNPLISLETRTMLRLLPEMHGLRIADVGAGTGRWAAHCATHGAFAVAVDFCYEMLRRASVPAIQADGRKLPLPDRCADVVVCAFALGYAVEMFAELSRIVTRGGSVLISDVHPTALRRGWKRTFRHLGRTIEVAHQSYSVDDLRVPDLRLVRLAQPALGQPEKAIFERAGCPERFEAASQWPAIFVAQWIRV